ncbi:MAG: MBOAT family protein [Bdellovibrionales bacterium]
MSSLFFYGWWSPRYVPLLLASILFSFVVSAGLTSPSLGRPRKKLLLFVSIFVHLLVLGFYKYGAFFLGAFLGLTGLEGSAYAGAVAVELPIGISFYTFTQIAFLVDCWQGKVIERRLDHYLLFVTYFPHLIAGPILHHAQMMPQFAKADIYKPRMEWIARGVVIFVFGLSKKLLIADPMSVYANALFDQKLVLPTFFLSWLGTIFYAFQIYFDFSGYSDMAIGLSLFFGIKLPVNFNSPYKATSIIDFWRRWHISLSTFLRDYLYIPLGGNRYGAVRRYINLFITMLLGGLWHGAGWTFILWGGFHGLLLAINHAWQKVAKRDGRRHVVAKGLSWLVTFVCVCLAWVLFRAETLSQAIVVYKGMLGLNGLSLPEFFKDKVSFLKGAALVDYSGIWQGAQTQGDSTSFILLLLAGAICWGAKNLNKVSVQENKVSFGVGQGVLIGGLFFLCLLHMASGAPAQFLYFRF